MVYKSNKRVITKANNKGGKLLAVRILDIILDTSHPLATKYGGYDAIGTIFFTKLDENIPLEKLWTNINNTARPVFSFLKNYPLKKRLLS